MPLLVLDAPKAPKAEKKDSLERLRSLTNEEMNRSLSVNGMASAISQPAPALQRSLRSPPQHMLNSDGANTPGNDGTLIPRPKTPSECWLQTFKTVSYPWERCLLPAGNQVPYYKNHATQETQWDHPAMIELLQKMDESNTIRFQAYRAAAKIRQLQLRLFFDQIPLNVATETFARHGLTSPLCNEGCDGRLMDVPQMVNCLTTLYCRLWDILVTQSDVVKINNASGISQLAIPTQQTSSKSYNSDSTVVGNNVQETPVRESTCNTDVKSKNKRTPTHRSAIKCMTSVLCTSSNKHNRDDEDCEDNNKRPLSPPAESRQVNEPTSPQHMLPVDTQPGSAYSRMDKLQTLLRLPDGREFSLLTCVDLALNLLLNSFDRGQNRIFSNAKFILRALCDSSYYQVHLGGVFRRSSCVENGIKEHPCKRPVFCHPLYLFSLVADRDNKINDSRLWLLVYEIMQLPRQLGEAQTCSSDLDMDILMCFMKCKSVK
ncbi:hypothetical protein ACTXT7_002360 [Hymenolepis weldensis]